MKRKTLIIVVLIVVAMIALFFLFKDYFIPQKIIKDGGKVEFVEVFYLNEQVSANTDQIVGIVGNYSSVKSFKDYFPYEQDSVQIEINMIVNHKPLHVLLGDFDVWYDWGNTGAYEIIDGEKLQSELEALLS